MEWFCSIGTYHDEALAKAGSPDRIKRSSLCPLCLCGEKFKPITHSTHLQPTTYYLLPMSYQLFAMSYALFPALIV